jgi:hypothetical protein
MTRSPFFVVITNIFVLRYCSATRGEILALNIPVPRIAYRSRVSNFISMLPKILSPHTESHDNHSNNKRSQRALVVVDHTGNSRNNQKDVSEENDGDGHTDGLEPTPVSIGNVTTNQGSDVGPKLVECRQTSRSLLTQPKGPRLAVAGTPSTSSRSVR